MQLDGVTILVNDLVVDGCQVVAVGQVGVGLLEVVASGGWGGGGSWGDCRQFAKHIRGGLCVGQNGRIWDLGDPTWASLCCKNLSRWQVGSK